MRLNFYTWGKKRAEYGSTIYTSTCSQRMGKAIACYIIWYKPETEPQTWEQISCYG